MNLVRYIEDAGTGAGEGTGAGAGQARVGLLEGDVVRPLPVPDMAALLRYPSSEIRSLVEAAAGAGSSDGWPLSDVELLTPIDGRTEVWGAGVTYLRSRSARVEESRHQLVYQDVYEAERPELFFKAPAWRVVTDGQPAGIRRDCEDSVAEPELALVLNRHAEIVGALVCNDVTARGIEAQNPIYLPQAKLYTGSCVLSAGIVPWWTITEPEDLAVTMEVHRAGAVAFAGQARTSAMKRTYTELAQWLFRGDEYPDGAVLSTGTGIVPLLGEGLRPGDVVTVAIDQVGTLTNAMVEVFGAVPADHRWK